MAFLIFTLVKIIQQLLLLDVASGYDHLTSTVYWLLVCMWVCDYCLKISIKRIKDHIYLSVSLHALWILITDRERDFKLKKKTIQIKIPLVQVLGA